jgi:hypothetical protein
LRPFGVVKPPTMKATTLIYSSHNCGPYIHRDWIVQRALESHDKRLVYLPMSEWPNEGDYMESQRFGWSKVDWFFGQYRQYGLRPQSFYWTPHLDKRDLETLWELLHNAPVVVLGGGNTRLGMQRYQSLGWKYNGDPHLFCRILHERQARGQLTVGFSAGADQLGSIFGGAMYADGKSVEGFGLARDIAVTLHHEWGRRDEIYEGATNIRHCSWFGLPNDSGLAISQGWLNSGLYWQLIQFVIDNSWDLPSDHHHIKTRQGMKIDHYYPDGRHWAFGGGEAMLRVMTPDGSARRAWLFLGGGIYEYETQRHSGFHSMGEILEACSSHSAHGY